MSPPPSEGEQNVRIGKIWVDLPLPRITKINQGTPLPHLHVFYGSVALFEVFYVFLIISLYILMRCITIAYDMHTNIVTLY